MLALGLDYLGDNMTSDTHCDSLSEKLIHADADFLDMFLDDPAIATLQNQLGYQFKDIKLLTHALTHKSFAHEKGIDNNEVLEFLGDAVLDLAITQKLIELFPEQEEGKLSKLRSAIVNKETLAQVARNINLQQVLLVGKGELLNKGNERDSNLSNALEAILGAIFNESGFAVARDVIDHLFQKSEYDYFGLEVLEKVDVKGQLQELVYKLYASTPEYKSEEIKVNKQTKFSIKLLIQNKIVAFGEFDSKKKGMQTLAAQALAKINTGEK